MKTKFIFILFFAICCSKFFATNKDSLFKVIKSNSIHDTVKYYAYYDLGWEYIYSNPDTTYLFAKKAFELVKKFKNKKNQPKILNLFGGYFQIKGDYYQAIDYYQKSLKIGEELNDPNIMLVAYGNIGALYINLQKYAIAKDYELKSLTIAEKNNKQDHLASIYNNLCVIELNLGAFNKSIEYGNKSLEINKIINDKNGICSATGNIGNAYRELNNIDKALVYFELCYNTAIEINNVYEETRSLSDIGNIYKKRKNYKEAINYFTQVKNISEKNEILSSLHQAYKSLYECYKSIGDKEKALKNFELYEEAHGMFLEASKEQEVNKKEVEFAFNKQAAADSIKNVEKNKYKDEILKANKAQIENDRLLKIGLTIGLIFFIGFGVLIFNRFRITNKQKIIIEAKNKQTEEQKLIIEEKQKEILDSINYAKRIQDSLLDNFDSVSRFFADAFVLNKPKDIVSGDFYWLNRKILNKQLGNNKSVVEEMFYVAVCDSTGHGVPGGFMSLLNTSYLSEAINEKNIYEPNKIFDYVRERLINTISKKDQKDGFDGVLMCFNKKFTFENKTLLKTEINLAYAAAHNAPVIVKNNQIIDLQTDKMPVGYGERKENFSLFNFPLEKNDLIYVFTDGYADQFGGPKGKKFKYKQLNEVLLQINRLPCEQQSDILNKTIEDWKGELEQVDDICIVGIRI